jgi:aspartate/methionine/tyrosine aminotransferase
VDILAKRGEYRHNLGPGEPAVVADIFDWTYNVNETCVDPSTFTYPAIGGDMNVKSYIRGFLRGHGLPHEGHLVITNGAKQALAAAFYGLDMKGALLHYGPYWPTLPSLAKLAGLKLSPTLGYADIVTSPNNPNGYQWSRLMGQGACRIWDAAYASPAYGWNRQIPPHEVAVFSMAKLFGVPGLRVGWALFKDEAAAERAAAYVEVQTSGVATTSQWEAARILSYFVSARRYEIFTARVSEQLRQNRKVLTTMWEPFMVDMSVAGCGMYLWAQAHKKYVRKLPAALKKAGIGYVGGAACGAGADLFRFNLARMENDIICAGEALCEVFK